MRKVHAVVDLLLLLGRRALEVAERHGQAGGAVVTDLLVGVGAEVDLGALAAGATRHAGRGGAAAAAQFDAPDRQGGGVGGDDEGRFVLIG